LFCRWHVSVQFYGYISEGFRVVAGQLACWQGLWQDVGQTCQKSRHPANGRRSTTAGPHYSSPTQPPLASGVATDHFQDCGPHMKCIHGVAPPYLQEFCVLVEKVQGCPRLRSASTGCVDRPRVQTSVGQRSFAFHGPTVNSLPSALCDSSLSLNTFKRRLKTYLFGQS